MKKQNEKDKYDELAARLDRLGIKDCDLEEKFIIGSGPGGQNLQKTSSCVWLKHLPSGIEIKCQKSRSREANRFFVRLLLCEALEEERRKEIQEQRAIQAKKRREKRTRSPAQKEKLVAQKRLISKKKMCRKSPRNDD
jgi:protein subunit release factor B